MTGEKIYE